MLIINVFRPSNYYADFKTKNFEKYINMYS